MSTYNERLLQKLELALAKREKLVQVVFVNPDGSVYDPNAPPVLIGGTAAARKRALAKWEASRKDGVGLEAMKQAPSPSPVVASVPPTAAPELQAGGGSQ